MFATEDAASGAEISGFETLNDGCGPSSVEQALEETVLFARGIWSQSEVLATQMEMFASVHEVIGEDGVGNGVAQRLFKGFFPVCDAKHERMGPPP